MKKTELTGWYPPHIKPVRIGFYNASRANFNDAMRYWDGKKWSLAWFGMTSIKRRIASDQDGISWRGLTRNPE